jgi:hypothetical protein
MNDRSCYITLEFGTFSTDQLFEVLLRDHQLWAEPDNRRHDWDHSRLMRRHFCPDDPAWQQMVLFRASRCWHRRCKYYERWVESGNTLVRHALLADLMRWSSWKTPVSTPTG